MVRGGNIMVPLLSFFCLLSWSTSLASVEIMEEFFPQLEGDLTRLTWAHAVNSRRLMNETLRGDRMMIEGDVIICRDSRDPKAPPKPMMGHPPATESDLSLKEFLEAIGHSNTHSDSHQRGIKLDFKSIEVFNASEPVLEEYLYKARDGVEFVPLWLNADIISGPINSKTKPVDADIFLRTVDEKFPNSIISVGWTTEMSEKNSVGGYTTAHINGMTAALSRNRISQPVSFPVRAGLAAQSREALISLIKTSVPGTTLTIWMSSENDPVSIPKLRCLIKNIGLNRTFIDVPDSVKNQLDLANIASATCAPETPPENENAAPMAASHLGIVLLAVAASLYVLS